LDNNITNPEIINSLDNLQPILRKDNARKGSKYDKQEFLEWLNKKGVYDV